VLGARHSRSSSNWSPAFSTWLTILGRTGWAWVSLHRGLRLIRTDWTTHFLQSWDSSLPHYTVVPGANCQLLMFVTFGGQVMKGSHNGTDCLKLTYGRPCGFAKLTRATDNATLKTATQHQRCCRPHIDHMQLDRCSRAWSSLYVCTRGHQGVNCPGLPAQCVNTIRKKKVSGSHCMLENASAKRWPSAAGVSVRFRSWLHLIQGRGGAATSALTCCAGPAIVGHRADASCQVPP
jgi:hypothetical protein